MKLIVGITGATGAIFGLRVLEELANQGVETHVCVSRWGRITLEHETGKSLADLRELATHVYSPGDLAAEPSSGSFLNDGMIVAPCSMRSLAAIATATGGNLITRAADVALKERRKLVLLTREAPLHEVHLQNMLAVTRMGAVIIPPVPAFYNNPSTIGDLVDHIVARALDQFGLRSDYAGRWTGELSRPTRALD